MSSPKTRSDLWEAVITAFCQQPEISQIYTFGREVDGETDQYSDLDLILCSRDLQETQRKYRMILSGISPIIGSYLIVSNEDCLAEMVMLQDYSPYQKVDFSITATIENNQQFAPFKLIYGRRTEATAPVTKLTVEGTAGDLRNSTADILFSIPRFTKCLFRQDRDMYRRWMGVMDRIFVLLYERHFGWQKQSRGKLTPPEYQALYKILDPPELRVLDRMMPLCGRINLAASFQIGMHQFTNLCREKAGAIEADLDDRFIEHITGFLDAEISRFLSDKLEA